MLLKLLRVLDTMALTSAIVSLVSVILLTCYMWYLALTIAVPL